MEPKESILTKDGDVDGKAVSRLRKRLVLTQAQLAEKSGLSVRLISDIECQKKPEQRSVETITKLQNILDPKVLERSAYAGQCPPSAAQMSASGAALQGKWLGWHWTRRRDGELLLAKTLWTVEENGHCVLDHVHTKVTFRGSLDFEADSRLIFTFKSEAAIPEHLVFRFDQPDAPDAGHLYGGWFGIDYGDRLRSDHALLTRRLKMSEAEAKQRLGELSEFMARPIVRPTCPLQDIGHPSSTDSVSTAKEIDDLHLLSTPSPKQLITLRNDLAFEWLEWHWTRKEGKPTVVKVAWKIEPDGRCLIRHVESGLTYRGSVRFEGDSRLVFVLLNSDARIEELAVYRFPSSPGARQLTGFWFGIDYHHQTLGDRSLLTRDLSMSAEQARKILDGLDAMSANPVERLAQSVRVEESWSDDEIKRAVIDSCNAEFITVISTYFPSDTALASWIQDAARARTVEGPLEVRILLMDPQEKALLAAREHHRDESPGQIERLIREQVDRFSKLSRDRKLASKAVIKLKLFSAWPFGTAIQLGNRAIYWGLMLATESSVAGPMFVLQSADKKLWELLDKDLFEVWDNARKPTPEDFPKTPQN